ncbi:MAG TPA: shikimate kinase [Symbiobacteriaceae bacterium]|nr:shikimate kinase [Symbiobacteriaceae bacterium]
MKLVLIGMMGAGKSTVGRLVAGALHRPFIDTDMIVEVRAGKLIREIFAEGGEGEFRLRETEAIREAVAFAGSVIATGGGAVLSPVNRELLRESAFVVWLDAEPEELYRRAMRQGAAARPLLNGPDPLAVLRQRRAERAEAYQQTAHIRINAGGRSPEETAAEVTRLLLAREGNA